MPQPATILFAASGEFGLPTLHALLAAGYQFPLVISQPDRPAGRGRHLTPTAIAQAATAHNLPLLRTPDINADPAALPPADLLIVIAFGQKVSPAVIQRARLGGINLHGSRLPSFRGAAPINAAILAGQTLAGNSVIRLAQRMDAGPILAQSSLPIGELETAGELHDRLAVDGAQLMLEAVARLLAGQATEVPQDDAAASRAPRLSRDSAKLDWRDPADAIARKVRAMYPWPACHIRLIDESGREKVRATLVRARAATAGPLPAARPGTILEDGTVAAAAGRVEIIELQPEGKRPMPLAAFRNGHPWHAGMRLESA